MNPTIFSPAPLNRQRPLARGICAALLVASVSLGVSAAQAQLVAGWNGTSAVGTSIMGGNTSGSYAAPGTSYSQFEGNTPPFPSLDDGNLGTYDTTFGIANDSAYFGFTFPAVSGSGLKFDINFRIFGDGGWYGPKGNATLPLSPSNLIAPTLQITVDGGATWTSLLDGTDYTNNYVSALTGANSGNTPLADFTTTAPVVGVNGIRVIGLGGGVAGPGNGFTGVADMSVTAVPVPEPSTGMAALAALGFAFNSRKLRGKRPVSASAV